MTVVQVIWLYKGAIKILGIVNRYFSIGFVDGNGHFYEAHLGLIGWFEKVHIGKSFPSC